MTTGTNLRRFRALMIRQARNVQRVAQLLGAESPCPQFTSKAVAGTAKTTLRPVLANPVRHLLRMTTLNPTANRVQTPVLRRINLRQIHHPTLQAPRLTPTVGPRIATRQAG